MTNDKIVTDQNRGILERDDLIDELYAKIDKADAKVLRLKEMNHALEEDNGILNSEIKALREKIDAMRANFTTQSWKIERLKADLEKEKKEKRDD